jgi:2-oxoglutarate ferredoxin oxidoreductase subunit beta
MTARGSPSRPCTTRNTTSPDKVSALRLLEESQRNGEFLSGLIYVDPKRRDFVTMQNMTPTPLALLSDEVVRPSKEVLEKIMETI